MQGYLSRRVIAVMLLSFSSTLPLILVGSTLTAWYTSAGISLLGIGALSLVQQPYIFKFIWAPLMDRFQLFGLGRRRGWILAMQVCLVLMLTWMAWMNPKTHPGGLALIALLAAFFSASQDIAIDAYRVDVLSKSERGMGSAVTSLAGRVAMLFGGALALVFAAEIGWQATYIIMAAVMALEVVVTLLSPSPSVPVKKPATVAEAIVGPIENFIKRKHIIVILIFILTYKMCDALALALNTPFLMRGAGFSLLELGTIYKTVSLVASLLGAAVGGVFYARLGMYRSLMIYGFLQAVSNLAYMWLAIIGKSYTVMVFSVAAEYFCGALAVVAFTAYLLSLCDRRFSATQYALVSAIMAIPRVYFGPLAAVMVDTMGWANFYFVTFLVGLPPLLLLFWMKHNVNIQFEYAIEEQ